MKIGGMSTFAALCGIAFGCIFHPAANGYHWRTQAAKVVIGMSRAEVETLLPKHPESVIVFNGAGSQQSVSYWVDENWRVSIAFDYSGVPRHKKGNAFDPYYSSENKVLAAPTLTRGKMPVLKEALSIKTIEHPPAGDVP